MANIQILSSLDTGETRFQSRNVELFPSAGDNACSPSSSELLLAAIGAETSEMLAGHCRNNAWSADNIYIELALHGVAPWQAIGRRIWVDGNLTSSQLGSLLELAEQLPIVGCLHPSIYMRSKVARLRRPDLE